MSDRSRRQEQRLLQRLRCQSQRLRRAEENRPTLFGQASAIGVLGLLLVLPLVGGGYLGLWLDEQRFDYSISWTLTMLLLGLAIGIANVVLFIRARE